MTIVGRDMSDFDTNENAAGYAFITHKFTEGTQTKHVNGPRRLTMYRDQGVPVLGAYHVLRTPGNNGNGSVFSQVDYFLSYLDQSIPWWRQHSHFILQIDAEKWPYDAVTTTHPMMHAEARALISPDHLAELVMARASTTIDFATALLGQNTGARAITYASRGQYDDALTGIPTDLWNANYGANNGTYPGDGAAAWRIYSDRTPVFLQYASNPYDKNAFRGTLNDLLSYVGGSDMNGTDTFTTMSGQTKTVYNFLGDGYDVLMNGKGPFAAQLITLLNGIASKVGIDQAELDAIKAAAQAGAQAALAGQAQEIITAVVAALPKGQVLTQADVESALKDVLLHGAA